MPLDPSDLPPEGATIEELAEFWSTHGAERILSLVTEEVPTAQVSHELRVDGRAAARLINQGGPAARRLLDLRLAKGRLTVTPGLAAGNAPPDLRVLHDTPPPDLAIAIDPDPPAPELTPTPGGALT